MDLVEDFAEPGVPFVAACHALGVSRATVYRGTCAAPPLAMHSSATNPRRLADDERQAIVDVMHSAEFVDQSPTEVFATLLGRGIYLASIRTIYRVLAALGETKERRNQRRPHTYAKPILTATAPNQVWTWDITKLATLQKGVFLHVLREAHTRGVRCSIGRSHSRPTPARHGRSGPPRTRAAG